MTGSCLHGSEERELLGRQQAEAPAVERRGAPCGYCGAVCRRRVSLVDFPAIGGVFGGEALHEFVAVTQSLSSLEKAPISHRRFQLQVLMDVAYIQGGLEGYDILRRISRDALVLADTVYSQSNGSETDMCRVIDELYKS